MKGKVPSCLCLPKRSHVALRVINLPLLRREVALVVRPDAADDRHLGAELAMGRRVRGQPRADRMQDIVRITDLGVTWRGVAKL